LDLAARRLARLSPGGWPRSYKGLVEAAEFVFASSERAARPAGTEAAARSDFAGGELLRSSHAFGRSTFRLMALGGKEARRPLLIGVANRIGGEENTAKPLQDPFGSHFGLGLPGGHLDAKPSPTWIEADENGGVEELGLEVVENNQKIIL
jgi:hypothetical protein